MRIPLLDLKSQYQKIKDEVNQSVLEVFESQYFVLGPKVNELEKNIAEYSNCRHAIGVSSGTDALIISLMAAGIGPGDEVITTPFSFFATAGSINRVGAKPVFADIEPATFNLDIKQIEKKITPATKAIIPVHLYGQMVDMEELMAIARKNGLIVIEDAAQAIGAQYKGNRAGSLGDYGCFSFFPSKNLGGAGDGGMVVTNNDDFAEKLRILRNHGAEAKYYHQVIGGNFRLDALQAVVLNVKLKYLDSWTEGRQNNAAIYRRLFTEKGIVVDLPQNNMQGVKGIVLPRELPEARHIYNQFVIRVDKREELREVLHKHEIGHEVYYPVAFHQQECFSYLGYKEGDFPYSEIATRECLALPVYPEMTEEMIQYVVDTIAEFILNK